MMKDFMTKMLGVVTPPFMINPASSTGKYHPSWSNIKGSEDVAGGLAKHTKAVCFLIHALAESEGLTPDEQDAAIIAGFAHDLLKYGFPEERYTRRDHEHLGAMFFKRCCKMFDENLPLKDEIFYAIAFHQGRYAYADPPKKFPEDFSKIAQLVHRADMVASRKQIKFTFLEEESLIG